MNIKDFWKWVESHIDECLVQYDQDANTLTLAIDERTLSSFSDTFVPDVENGVYAMIRCNALLVDVAELLDNVYSALEIWNERITGLNIEW